MSGYAGDESIYGLIPEPFHVPPKQPLYRSKFPGERALPPAAPCGDSNVNRGAGCEHAPICAPAQRRPPPPRGTLSRRSGRGAPCITFAHRAAKASVLSVSAVFREAGEQAHTTAVRAFPPSAADSSRVSLESRYGTWPFLAELSIDMTVDSVCWVGCVHSSRGGGWAR